MLFFLLIISIGIKLKNEKCNVYNILNKYNNNKYIILTI